jgi:predicted NAD/FAD-binding protein
MGVAIWSILSDKMNEFPTRTFLQFFKNHGLLGITTQHQWLTVSNGSVNYVNKIKEKVSGKIYLSSDVVSLKRESDGVVLVSRDGTTKHYDKVVLAMHAPDAMKLLADISDEEKEILSCFSYKQNDALLHNDANALYPDRNIYAAWNYKNNEDSNAVTLSYWINRLQNLKSEKEYFVSLNEIEEIEKVIERINYEHPQFNILAIKAQALREEISGINNTYFAGAYWRNGFHEDGLWSANEIAKQFGCEL